MTVISTTEAKAQCRVSDTAEDALFTIYVNAAEDWIKNYLNMDQIPQKNAIKAAALLIVEDLYKNRGSTTDMKTYKNMAVDSLLYPYRSNIGI